MSREAVQQARPALKTGTCRDVGLLKWRVDYLRKKWLRIGLAGDRNCVRSIATSVAMQRHYTAPARIAELTA